jgi:hypothetical protein
VKKVSEMINLLPEPKFIHDEHAFSKAFDGISFLSTSDNFDVEWLLDIAKVAILELSVHLFFKGRSTTRRHN